MALLKTLAVALMASATAVLDIQPLFDMIPAADASLGATITNCGTSADKAQNLQVTLNPSSPTPGSNMTLTFDYDLTETITGGTADYKVVLNGIPYTSSKALCTQEACPIAAGHQHDVSTSEFPAGITGKMISSISWTDQNGAPVLCVKMVFNVA